MKLSELAQRLSGAVALAVEASLPMVYDVPFIIFRRESASLLFSTHIGNCFGFIMFRMLSGLVPLMGE